MNAGTATPPEPWQAACAAFWAAVEAGPDHGADPAAALAWAKSQGAVAAWKAAAAAARQPQPAPGGALRERLALLDIIAAISEHDEADVKYPVELLVSIERLAELAIADGEPHACEPLSVKPADDVKPAPELAAATATLARVLSWFAEEPEFGPSRRYARATRAQLAHAYKDGGLSVPEGLRRFL